MTTQGGPAQPVAQSNGPVQGGAALPVAFADGPVQGGASLPIQFVTGRTVQGGAALPIQLSATGIVQGGAPIAVTAVGAYAYTGKVVSTLGSSLIAYYPLAEPAGALTAYDVSGNGRHGAYHNVTLGIAGIGDGRSAALFGGAGYVNIAAVAPVFNGAEWSIVVWCYNLGSGATALRIINIEVDTNNFVRIRYTPSTSGLVWQYTAGGTNKQITLVAALPSFHCFALTCSRSAGASGELKAYFDGPQTGTTQTALGTWTGAPAATTTVIGAGNTAAAMGWNGGGAHVALCHGALPAVTIARLAQVGP